MAWRACSHLCSCCRATIDEVETDVVEIEAKLDKVKAGPRGEWRVLGCALCPRAGP